MQAYELDSPERLRAPLARERQLYQPQPDGQGALRWQVLDDPSQPFVVPVEPPVFSAKAFFFAEREALFRYESGRFIALQPQVRPQVLFGLAACDLTAVAYQDRFFAADPHYQARRAATLLVGLDCAQSCQHGFCAMMDSGPEVRAHTADLILRPLGRRWLLLVTSERGQQALAGLVLARAPADWAQQRDAQALQVAAEQGEQAEIALGCAALNGETVDSQAWKRSACAAWAVPAAPRCARPVPASRPSSRPNPQAAVCRSGSGIPACTGASSRRPAVITPARPPGSASGTTSSATTSASASAATVASVAGAATRCAPAASACTR